MACCGECFAAFLRREAPVGTLIKNKDVQNGTLLVQSLGKQQKVRNTQLCEALLDAIKSGDPDKQLPNGNTALHEAAACDNVRLTRELTKAGAKFDIKNQDGDTPLTLAKKRGSSECVSFFSHEGSQISTSQFLEDVRFITTKVPLFKTLPPSEYPAVAAVMKSQTFQPGEDIVRQGDEGTAMYILEKGSAKVLVIPGPGQAPQQVAELSAGDYFGEVALLSAKPRNATIQAATVVRVKVLERRAFQELGLRQKLYFKKRKAVCQKDTAQYNSKGESEKKTEAQLTWICEGLRNNENLGPMLAHLSKDEMLRIAQTAYSLCVKSGDKVIVQDDTDADAVYVVQDGTFDVLKSAKKVHKYSVGGCFGELAIMYRHPRAATVAATSRGKLWVLPRQAFGTVMQARLKAKLDTYVKMLMSSKFLHDAGLSDAEWRSLADSLLDQTYTKGQYIIKQGEEGDAFFILIQGDVQFEQNGKSVGSASAKNGQLQFFGEQALETDQPRAASVKCTSKEATCLVLHRSVYLEVVRTNNPAVGLEVELMQYRREKLKKLGLLGCGGFGTVTLEKDTMTGQTFAVKALSKGFIVANHQELSIMNEKTIMRMTNSPFLVRLAATFNSKDWLYFLMEAALGGELFTVYQDHQFYKSEPHAKFYSACVAKAFEHLHARKIIYRDLKPENLLLDGRGYCKVADFGLAKFVIGHTFTTCGTPEYFAPEMVKNCGHTVAVDWWTLGILIYEFMTSETPFADPRGAMSIFQKVVQGFDGSVKFPRGDSPWAELVRQLCQQEPQKRLAMQNGGCENVFSHRWFNKFSWSDLCAKTMKAPYLPGVRSPEDISNFHASEDDAPPFVPYHDPKTGWDRDFEDRTGPRNFL
eukprot:TRINITY_DN1693_c0_g1_i1.p1 TRINITY_DN1693_c0_g1~~TRINITY_DN1693_c0_g1_i1.p1  ORF type:complete len:868 (-),score=235.57 TRINITY_DN1693_c0_g1_i1:567-3170(-)